MGWLFVAFSAVRLQQVSKNVFLLSRILMFSLIFEQILRFTHGTLRRNTACSFEWRLKAKTNVAADFSSKLPNFLFCNNKQTADCTKQPTDQRLKLCNFQNFHCDIHPTCSFFVLGLV